MRTRVRTCVIDINRPGTVELVVDVGHPQVDRAWFEDRLLQPPAPEDYMTRISFAVLGGVALATLSLNAQQTQSVPPTPSTGPSMATITVVGCIENAVADGSLGGTPLGTSATPADAPAVANAQPRVDGFLLTGARPAEAAAVGTSGAAAAAD